MTEVAHEFQVFWVQDSGFVPTPTHTWGARAKCYLDVLNACLVNTA